MKTLMVLAIAFSPSFAVASQSTFVRTQVGLLNQQREWILQEAARGGFAQDPGTCVFFADQLKRLKENGVRTALAVGDDADAIRAVATLDTKKVCGR